MSTDAFMTATIQLAVTLQLLPPEITVYITDCLCVKDVKNLSLVCRKMREVSLSRIFRNVQFEFSHHGFNALRELSLCDLRYYVVSFTYTAPEILHPGRDLRMFRGFSNIFLEIQNLDCFKETVLKPKSYDELSTQKTSFGYLSDVHVPYMQVYDTFKYICQEQNAIVECCEDLLSLSNAFRKFPRLGELCLDFCPTLNKDSWIPSHMDQTISESTVRHHVQVIALALKAGRNCGIHIHTIHLSNLELSFVSLLSRDPKLHLLRLHLSDLLKYALNLRLSGSGSPLKVLASTDLDLQHLELCQVTVPQAVFFTFVQNKADSIGSIECHEVRLIAPSSAKSTFVELSSEGEIFGFYTVSETASLCAICLKEGCRLLRKK